MKKIAPTPDNSRILRHNILTQREIEYLSLAALGYKNKQIAKILFVSYSAVKKTFETVYRKLSAKDRANAVAEAFVLGILTPRILTDIYAKYNNTFQLDTYDNKNSLLKLK